MNANPLSDRLLGHRLTRAEIFAAEACALEQLTDPDIKARLRAIPESMRGIFRRVYTGAAGKTERVKAKCLDCCCYQRIEVTRCTSRFCPMHSIRPYQDEGEMLSLDVANEEP